MTDTAQLIFLTCQISVPPSRHCRGWCRHPGNLGQVPQPSQSGVWPARSLLERWIHSQGCSKPLQSLDVSLWPWGSKPEPNTREDRGEREGGRLAQCNAGCVFRPMRLPNAPLAKRSLATRLSYRALVAAWKPRKFLALIWMQRPLMRWSLQQTLGYSSMHARKFWHTESPPYCVPALPP